MMIVPSMMSARTFHLRPRTIFMTSSLACSSAGMGARLSLPGTSWRLQLLDGAQSLNAGTRRAPHMRHILIYQFDAQAPNRAAPRDRQYVAYQMAEKTKGHGPVRRRAPFVNSLCGN
ncbi:exported protein of unknown function (plasmid) [Azospirillum baldaniorum]|uniref:Uncharacterized protein n=1 Tax=Azospirillum baldaniorum TaxID=1064539 RepID=A0A9P1JXK7_9PROT|nr:exported protein of unknown function [Azospirillum baldaniorum]